MSGQERMGREVLGPVVAEFCYRLWTITQQLDEPDDTALLFCARGGLRIQLAYERFLDATGLGSTTRVAPLMVSRVAAIRGALLRTVHEQRSDLLPAVAAALGHEFAIATVREAATVVSGHAVTGHDPRWDERLTPDGLIALLTHADGAGVVDALETQEQLFDEHLELALGGRSHALLIDTGFFGTTRELLAEGHPELDVASVLLARSFRPGLPRRGRTTGLLVEADEYAPLRRRTSLLRYWHFVEWLFEPDLASVTSFRRESGRVVSNLEVPGWEQFLAPTPGSAFAGVLTYLESLPHGPAGTIVVDSDRAWRRLHQAIVFPTCEDAEALALGSRTLDFGREGTWGARPWRGPTAALRGTTLWREGEISASGTRLRRPLLVGIESAYGARLVSRRLRRRLR